MRDSSLLVVLLVIGAVAAFALDAFAVRVGRVKLVSLGFALLTGAYLAATLL